VDPGSLDGIMHFAYDPTPFNVWFSLGRLLTMSVDRMGPE